MEQELGLDLNVTKVSWPMAEPFTIARGTMTHCDAVLVELRCGDISGRSEAYGIIYEGETPDSIIAEIEAVRAKIEAGIDRAELQNLLGIGGARCAIDCALWDLEAKQRKSSVAAIAGLAGGMKPLETAYTIGIRNLEDVRRTAAERSHHKLLKIKLNAEHHLDVIEAVRAAAPNSRFIIDPNQSWDLALLDRLMPDLQRLGVVLLEQPLPVDGDDGLLGYSSPIPICADELIDDRSDLHKARGKYQVINIKLDKAGGLTEALALAHAAIAEGYRLMVGCMAGSSLSMAPAMVVGQYCDFVDLDGPLLQTDDWPNPIRYEDGIMSVPEPVLWG